MGHNEFMQKDTAKIMQERERAFVTFSIHLELTPVEVPGKNRKLVIVIFNVIKRGQIRSAVEVRCRILTKKSHWSPVIYLIRSYASPVT